MPTLGRRLQADEWLDAPPVWSRCSSRHSALARMVMTTQAMTHLSSSLENQRDDQILTEMELPSAEHAAHANKPIATVPDVSASADHPVRAVLRPLEYNMLPNVSISFEPPKSTVRHGSADSAASAVRVDFKTQQSSSASSRDNKRLRWPEQLEGRVCRRKPNR